ncbi:MAG: exosortase-associated EpsI family protein [Planctomycetota bacterium]
MRGLAWLALLLAGALSFAVDRGLLGRAVPPDLERLPVELGPLRRTAVIPVEAAVLGDLPPERFLFTTVRDEGNREGRLYVAWFARGRRWSGRPHSAEFCFAAEGWREVEAHRLLGADGRGRWSRRFERDGSAIRIVHWFETPGRAVAGGWFARLRHRLTGGGGAGLRQDEASIYWEFPAEAAPRESDLLAASEALAAALHRLWGE